MYPDVQYIFDYWQWLLSIYTYGDGYHSFLDASFFGDLGASSEFSDTASCNQARYIMIQLNPNFVFPHLIKSSI
jgi:hypothetical protein